MGSILRTIKPPKDFIVGFGTGRCGTVSFSDQFNIWHEWHSPKYLSETNTEDWLSECIAAAGQFGKNYGDMSLDHINNLDYWLNQDVQRIVLMRDREETANSILNYRTTEIWERLFPQFDFTSLEGIYKYWDWYYNEIFKHERDFVIISPYQLEVHNNGGQIWTKEKS